MNPARSVATLVQVFLGPFVVLLLVLNSQIVMAGAQSGSPTTDPSKPSASDMTLELMTPPEDVDFGPYLASVFKAIRLKWSSLMPASVAKGEQGKVVVRFRIQQDGTMPPESLTFSTPRSDKPPLEVAAEYAVRRAAPFDALPAKFKKPFIDMRVTFLYNIARDKHP